MTPFLNFADLRPRSSKFYPLRTENWKLLFYIARPANGSNAMLRACLIALESRR